MSSVFQKIFFSTAIYINQSIFQSYLLFVLSVFSICYRQSLVYNPPCMLQFKKKKYIPQVGAKKIFRIPNNYFERQGGFTITLFKHYMYSTVCTRYIVHCAQHLFCFPEQWSYHRESTLEGPTAVHSRLCGWCLPA